MNRFTGTETHAGLYVICPINILPESVVRSLRLRAATFARGYEPLLKKEVAIFYKKEVTKESCLKMQWVWRLGDEQNGE